MDTKVITINRRNKLSFQTNEAYKSLRSNMEFCGNNVKVIAITSCVPNEGKSSVSFNLAISMAEAGKHVLFIDGDMRKSVILGRYQITRITSGLSHFLAGKRDRKSVV